MLDLSSTLHALARACARRLPATPTSFREDVPHFEAAYDALLSAVTRADARVAFDLEGRPAAIEAIRRALPAVEGDLLDAVLEDVACELAATREALYLLATAGRGEAG